MAMTMLIHSLLRFPDEIFLTDIFPMVMDYAIWIYNRIPHFQSVISDIEIFPSSMFDTVAETIINFHVWFIPTYVLE